MESYIFEGFLKSETERVVGTIHCFKGRWLADVRVMRPSATTEGEWIPTKAGVSLDVKRIAEVREAVAELSEVAAREKVIAKIPKNRREQVWVGLSDFKGEVLPFIRTFYKAEDDVWKPSPRGVSFRVSQLPDLEELVVEMAAFIEEEDLSDCGQTGED
jgi:hypothetical protein